MITIFKLILLIPFILYPTFSCTVYKPNLHFDEDKEFFVFEKEVSGYWAGMEIRTFFFNNSHEYKMLLIDIDMDGYYDEKCECSNLEINIDSLWKERLKHRAAYIRVTIKKNKCYNLRYRFYNWNKNDE